MTPHNNLNRFSRSIWLTSAVFVVFAVFFVIYVQSEKKIDRANELRLQSNLLSGELRQSSDDLTRMVRSYVITGDPVYKQHFQEILNIRDGKRPRPVNYHDIFWDLVLTGDPQPGLENGQNIALLDLMRQTGFTEEEFSNLARAKANSDALTETEFAAIKLLESTPRPTDANRIKASLMLNDSSYLQTKASIMRPIRVSYEMMDQRTSESVHVAEKSAFRLRMVFIAFGLLLILMLWRAYLDLYATLGSSVNELHRRIIQLGSGDDLSAIPVAKGMENSVLGWLSATQIRLAGIDTQRKESEARNQRLTQLYAALSQCNQAIVRCNNQEELFPQICRDAVTLGGMKMAWIGLLDKQSKQLKFLASYGAGTEYLDNIQISANENEAAGRGPTGTAIREDRPFWCQDFLNDPVTAPWRERGAKFGWGASASLPLHRNGVVIGAFTLYNAEISAFDEDVRNLLVEMAMDIDFALYNFEREEQRVHAESSLADSHHLLQTVIDTAPVRIFWKSKDLRYLGCNPAFAKDAGEVDASSIIGKDDFQLSWHEQAELFRAYDQQVIDTGAPKLFYEEMLVTSKGNKIWLRTSKVPLQNEAKETIGILGVYEDITERKCVDERIHYLANFDPLTGLPNRVQLNEHLKYALSLTKRSNGKSALMLLDLDHFKDINDTLGHSVGDILRSN